MAYDKVVDSAKLDAAMQATADAIRGKSGNSAPIPWDESTGFANDIAGISSGIDTSDATAAASDLAEGKTAYVNGEKITGTMEKLVSFSSGNQEATLSVVNDHLTFTYSLDEKCYVENKIASDIWLPLLGDATAADVAAGKTFTSASGLNVVGTAETEELPDAEGVSF